MLTGYEKKQIKLIKNWEYIPHYIIKQCWDIVFLPLPDMFIKYIPFESLEKVLEMSSLQKDFNSDKEILLRINSVSLVDLREKGLEFSDSMAEKVCKNIDFPDLKELSSDVVVEFLQDIPDIIYHSLRLIYQIGICYGYEITTNDDKNYLLAALLSVCGNPFQATPAVVPSSLSNMYIREISTRLGCEVTMRKFIVQNPYLNIFLGKSAAKWYFQDISLAARRIFQERWLIDHGKWN